MRAVFAAGVELNEHFYIRHTSRRKVSSVALSIYTSREGHTLRAEYEGQYKIKIYVAPHNETDTGVLNRNVATVETNYRKFPKLIAIGVNLKNLIYSYIFL